MTPEELVARLEPELAALLPGMPQRDLSSIDTIRSTLAKPVAAPSETVVQSDHLIARTDAPDLRVRHYAPHDADGLLPCLLWFHGGGFIMGTLEAEDARLQWLVETTGCAVLSVDWRLAPENPYPASMNDAYSALAWLFENAPELGVDSARIAVGGGSSGAGTAAGLALLARDRGDFDIHFQLLIYPMLDDRQRTVSSQAITDPRLWNSEVNGLAWSYYLGGIEDVPQYAAPARATDLTRLPPAYIAVGDLDLFLDEDIDYAQRLLRAGVPTELHVYPGAVHGFYNMTPDSPRARQFKGDFAEALRRNLFPTA